MNIETLEKIARNQKIPDEHVETAFNLLVSETLANSAIIVSALKALKLLKEHRSETAQKAARVILATATDNK